MMLPARRVGPRHHHGIAAEALDGWRAKPQANGMAADYSTSAVAVGGCRIRLMRGGAGEPLLYLHGASGANWLPFLQTLAKKFDVIAPEHPGFGESDTPAWLDNIHDLAYFYLDLIESLQVSGVHLVGNSLGGWVVAELAVRSTQRLASLTLAGSAGLYVAGVAQVDSYMISEEQRLTAFFHDQSKAKEMIARVLSPDMEDTALKSTAPDGKVVINEYKSGETRFNRRDRTHSELLIRGTGSAVMTELK